jgi:hypothetical protein
LTVLADVGATDAVPDAEALVADAALRDLSFTAAFSVAAALEFTAFAALAVAFLGAPGGRGEPLPVTLSEPAAGTTVDSSPVDHLILRSPPLTPVTTPSRTAWPTLGERA